MWSTILSIIVVINELMASNAGKVMSPATNFDSWIELYNPSEQAVNLGGMYLSNDASNLKYWQLPNNFGTIPAKGFKVVWLGSNNIKSDQAPFKLDCDGGTIYLSDKNGNMVTSQEYPKAMSRTAWALKTDGGSEWGWTDNATPGESNATAQFATERLAAPVVNVDSKLFKSSQTVKVTIPVHHRRQSAGIAGRREPLEGLGEERRLRGYGCYLPGNEERQQQRQGEQNYQRRRCGRLTWCEGALGG